MKINIDWTKIGRNILARNMQDLMYFNGMNVELDEDIEGAENQRADTAPTRQTNNNNSGTQDPISQINER